MRKSTPQNFSAEVVHGGYLTKLWLVRDQNRVVVCFVEKWNPRRGYTDPYKVFRAVCGQGPVHRGEMVAADYQAKSPIEAAELNRSKL